MMLQAYLGPWCIDSALDFNPAERLFGYSLHQSHHCHFIFSVGHLNLLIAIPHYYSRDGTVGHVALNHCHVAAPASPGPALGILVGASPLVHPVVVGLVFSSVPCHTTIATARAFSSVCTLLALHRRSMLIFSRLDPCIVSLVLHADAFTLGVCELYSK